MEGEARVSVEPLTHLWMLMGGVHDCFGRYLCLNGVQEADALLVTMALHTSANAQQSTMPVIGFLGFGSPRSNTGLLTAFVKSSPKRAMSKVEMLRSNFGGVMFYWHK